jgi:ketosteroid isomerase-like protein
MSTKLVFTLLACACLFLIGCAQPPPVDTRADVDALRNIEAQWITLIKARDIDKMLSLAAPAVVLMGPNAPLSVGHQALREGFESWLSDTLVSKTFSSTTDTVEVAASGDLAYIRGTNRYSFNTSKGPVNGVDKWVTIYKKIDGKWKATVDIYNSDMPLSGQ